MQRKERTRLVLPTSLEEARAIRAALLEEIEDIGRQLDDSSHAVREGMPEDRLVEIDTWRRRASVARRHRESRLEVIDRWMSQHASASNATVAVSRRGALSRLAAQEAQTLRYLDLLRRAYDLFELLRAEEVDLDSKEEELIAQIGQALGSRRSLPLIEARACVDQVGNKKDLVRTWAEIARHTRDPGDLAFLKSAMRPWLAKPIDGSREDVFQWVVEAFLACGDAAGALMAISGHAFPSRWRWARIYASIYERSRDPSCLVQARSIARASVENDLVGPALAWTQIFLSSHDEEDGRSAREAIRLAEEGATQGTVPAERYDGMLWGLTAIYCAAGDEERAESFATRVSGGKAMVDAYAHLSRAFPEAEHAETAFSEAERVGFDLLPFGTLRALARACLAAGSLDLVQRLASEVSMPSARCSIRCLLAAEHPDDRKARRLLDEAVVLLGQAESTSPRAHKEQTVRAARADYAWALAVRGEIDLAMSVARRIPLVPMRCTAFLRIDAAQSGLLANDDPDD